MTKTLHYVKTWAVRRNFFLFHKQYYFLQGLPYNTVQREDEQHMKGKNSCCQANERCKMEESYLFCSEKYIHIFSISLEFFTVSCQRGKRRNIVSLPLKLLFLTGKCLPISVFPTTIFLLSDCGKQNQYKEFQKV